MKQLFFDDEFLFARENVRRAYGKPEPVAVYRDGVCETVFCTGSVFCIDGKYRLIYFGICRDGKKRVFCAESRDGVHFAPENVRETAGLADAIADHQIMTLSDGQEVAEVYEDPVAPPAERYKMLIADLHYEEFLVDDVVLTSPDLIRWERKEGARWGYGTEPVTGVFYNSRRGCHTVLLRPFWGVRQVGYVETRDFVTLSEFNPCMHQDAADEPLAEIYGMKAMEYEGNIIGFPQIYCKLQNAYNGKYSGGREEIQLAYSPDGRYWLRSLHEPFISGSEAPEITGGENAMAWFGSCRKIENGDVMIYTAGTHAEHGHFHAGTEGSIVVYRLRSDGFICLESQDPAQTSRVTTREYIWQGGELRVNLSAKAATVGIFETAENGRDINSLGFAHPVPGFGHEDCVPFSGDSTGWVPQFKNGKDLSEFAGRTIVIEVRFEDGRLYSLQGDALRAFNTEASRYRVKGILPQKR